VHHEESVEILRSKCGSAETSFHVRPNLPSLKRRMTTIESGVGLTEIRHHSRTV
jgi:hypothetical protein